MDGEGAWFSPKTGGTKRKCCVPRCTSVSESSPHLRFHAFPKEGEIVSIENGEKGPECWDRREYWMKVLKVSGSVTKKMFVCSRHFLRSDYLLPDHAAKQRHLKRVAVPSLNLPKTSLAAKDLWRCGSQSGQRWAKSRKKVITVSTDSEKEAQKNTAKASKESQMEVSQRVELGPKDVVGNIKKEADDNQYMSFLGNIPRDEVITDDIPSLEMLMPVPVKLVEVKTGKEIHFNDPLHFASKEEDKGNELPESMTPEKEGENIFEPKIVLIPQKIDDADYQPIMSAQKRKRTDFTLKEKKEIIDAAKKEPNQSKLAREISKKWGVEVKRTTVKGILSKKDAIESAIKAGVPSNRMKLTQAHDPKLDEGVLTWLKQVRGQNLPVSGDLIKEKAMKLAELMHIPDFMTSDGWLENFKKRHGITFNTVQGEAGAVDLQSLLEWQQQVLRPLLGQFSEDDVFNLDETGLFWQLLPNKSMAFRGERCTGGKKSKQRITLLVGANMSGSEKLPLLVIGNSKSAFKNNEIPVKYKENSKAWMTAELFEETLHEWDGLLGQQGRRVLVCLDNFFCHPPELQLNNMQLVFFPPNTTANSQPMDQGIIQNLKLHYKKLLLCRRLEAMDEGQEFKFTLLDALHVARRAWEQVCKSTIRNCFAKAKFIEEEIQTEPQDAELLEIWEALPVEEKMHENGEIKLSDFLKADEHLVTGGSFTLEEIAEEMLCGKEPVESEDEEVTVEEEIVPFVEAQCAWSTVRKFMQQRSGKPGVMQACDLLDNEMHEIRRMKMRQPTILEGFGLESHAVNFRRRR